MDKCLKEVVHMRESLSWQLGDWQTTRKDAICVTRATTPNPRPCWTLPEAHDSILGHPWPWSSNPPQVRATMMLYLDMFLDERWKVRLNEIQPPKFSNRHRSCQSLRFYPFARLLCLDFSVSQLDSNVIPEFMPLPWTCLKWLTFCNCLSFLEISHL